MVEPLLSIIIPVHNLVESGPLPDPLLWLNDCPSSRLEGVQFVVIDDASSDSSRDLLVATAGAGGSVEHVSLGTRVGPGAARNVGLEHATGTFVFFADADDQFDLEMLVRACTEVLDKGLDILALGYEVCLDSGECFRSVPSDRDSLGSLLQRRAAIWRFLFRRSFLDHYQIAFPSLQYAEDILFMLTVASNQPRLGVLPGLAYRYRLHDRGLSGPPPNPRDARLALDQLAAARRMATLQEVKSLSDIWRLKIYRRVAGSIRPSDLPDLAGAVACVLFSNQAASLIPAGWLTSSGRGRS